MANEAPSFVVSIIKEYWKPGSKILEVGCGPAYLRKHFKEDYIGTDITDKDYDTHLPRQVDYVCPAEALTLPNESIDIVVIKSALFLFNNIEEALNEVKRVLKQNGILLLFDYNTRTQKILAQREGGHTRYPGWSQWGLQKRIAQLGFKNPRLYLPMEEQPKGFKKWYHLLRQELFGTWAIVSAEKYYVK